jgi:predicted XRE-type DNA-binding protein
VSAQTVLEGMAERLQGCRDRVNSARIQLKNELLLRNHAIVAAVDGGMSQTQVANNVGIGQPTVVKVLALPDDIALPA